MKHPWMPLFWGDFLANTMALSAQEAGAYLFLIAHAWENDGAIPADKIRLARIAHVRPDQWNNVWGALQHFFVQVLAVPSNGGPPVRQYTQPRVCDELHRLDEISNKRKEAALQKQRKSFANGHANAEQTGVHLTSTSTIKESSLGKGREAPLTKIELVAARRAFEESNEFRSPPRAKPPPLKPLPDRLKAPDQPRAKSRLPKGH